MPIISQGNQVSSSAQISPNVVLTGNIKDGEIVDADISASAAVGWTKVSKTGSRISDLASHDINDTDTTLGVNKGGTGMTSMTAHKLHVGNGTAAPNEIALGSATQVLTSNGASSDPTFQTINFNALSAATASANIRTSDDASATLVGLSSYTKIKEFLLNDSGGTIRVAATLSLHCSGSTSAVYYKVYKNGSAVGTEHNVTVNGSTDTNYTDDLTFASGDLIQIYGYMTNNGGITLADVHNCRLEYDKAFLPSYTSNTVNL